MATSSSKTTRKASTSRAATSTSKSDTGPAATEAADETAAASAATGSEQPADDQSDSSSRAGVDQTVDQTAAANDPAAALKQKIRTTQHITDPKPDELTDEQRLNLVGAPASALPGPRTLSSPTTPVRKGEEYVTVESDGYVATIPERAKQPATVRVWVQGQRVRKDMHDALSGIVATSAADAPVLDGDSYAQVAPYL